MKKYLSLILLCIFFTGCGKTSEYIDTTPTHDAMVEYTGKT